MATADPLHDPARRPDDAPKHTAGPWRMFTAKGGQVLVGIGDSEGGGITDCGFGTWRSGAEQMANARLIAAAPDLLEALRQLTENAVTARGCGLQNDADGIVSSALFDTIMQARTAYAKATGADQ